MPEHSSTGLISRLRDRLPMADHRLVLAHNVLARPRLPWSASIASRPVRVTWRGRVEPLEPASPLRTVNLGNAHAVISIPHVLLEWIAPGSCQDQRWRSLSDTSIELLARAALGNVYAAIEEGLGVLLTLGNDGELDRTLAWFAMDVHAMEHDTSRIVHIGLDDCASHLFAAAIRHVHAEIAMDHRGLRIPVSIVAGRQSLTVAQLQRLAAGDIIMVDRETGGHAAIAGNRELFVVTPPEDGYVRIIRPASAPKGLAMKTGAAAVIDASDLVDTIALHLTCELARIELTVAELRACVPGTTLQVCAGLVDAVHLRVNDQLIGKGELVLLGEGLGVRVTRLHHHE
jgi:type III secretion protein Q